MHDSLTQTEVMDCCYEPELLHNVLSWSVLLAFPSSVRFIKNFNCLKIFADLNDSLSKHLSKDQISAKDHKRREEEKNMKIQVVNNLQQWVNVELKVFFFFEMKKKIKNQYISW
jgi:hypothetical protein